MGDGHAIVDASFDGLVGNYRQQTTGALLSQAAVTLSDYCGTLAPSQGALPSQRYLQVKALGHVLAERGDER